MRPPTKHHSKVTNIKQQKYVNHLKRPGYEHLYSPRMVEEIKEEKNGTSNKQTLIWPNYLNYSV